MIDFRQNAPESGVGCRAYRPSSIVALSSDSATLWPHTTRASTHVAPQSTPTRSHWLSRLSGKSASMI
jgi:hypothetical protein